MGEARYHIRALFTARRRIFLAHSHRISIYRHGRVDVCRMSMHRMKSGDARLIDDILILDGVMVNK